MNNYKEIKRNNGAFLNQLKLMTEYVNAAANLYGFVDSDVFLSWLTDDMDMTVPFETKQPIDHWMITLISITALSQKHYYYHGSEFASNKFVNIEDATMFDMVLDTRPDFPPYIPSKSEIKRFSYSTFDKNSLPYKRFTKELRKVAKDYNMVHYIITTELIKGSNITQLINILNQEDIIVFNSAEEMDTFAESVFTLNNDTRMWVNYGNKPDELD
ncbi:hypothetical protein [Aerococcus sp. L_32]|uniref:hypothetical protein n=1 Tax=Aerococcus sp. L_32 TaxID=3422316 RepID=UPI003D6C05A1